MGTSGGNNHHVESEDERTYERTNEHTNRRVRKEENESRGLEIVLTKAKNQIKDQQAIAVTTWSLQHNISWHTNYVKRWICVHCVCARALEWVSKCKRTMIHCVWVETSLSSIVIRKLIKLNKLFRLIRWVFVCQSLLLVDCNVLPPLLLSTLSNCDAVASVGRSFGRSVAQYDSFSRNLYFSFIGVFLPSHMRPHLTNANGLLFCVFKHTGSPLWTNHLCKNFLHCFFHSIWIKDENFGSFDAKINIIL